jgi:NhaP-type Na+/H+ or K+/H+ antiporter
VVKIICLFVCFFYGSKQEKRNFTEHRKELSTVGFCRFIFFLTEGEIFVFFFEHLTTFPFLTLFQQDLQKEMKNCTRVCLFIISILCVRACWVCFCLSAWMCACNQPKFKNSTAVARRKQWQKNTCRSLLISFVVLARKIFFFCHTKTH